MSLQLPFAFARGAGVLVLEEAVDAVAVGVRAGSHPTAIAEARRALGRPLRARLLPVEEFDRQLAARYGAGERSMAQVADDIGGEMDLSALVEKLPPIEDLLEAADDAPIIRMINALLSQAVREHASDVHIEPFESYSAVRLRRDGELLEVLRPQRALHAAMVSRIKIMANLDIAEKRLPQDGRIGVRLAGRAVDVRVSTLPTHHGERVVLRLLEKDPSRLRLDVLGMGTELRCRVEALVRQPHGMVLVTGPTGSGKTTTLYAALAGLDAGRLNIVTVEDPVEYDLPGLGQIQVNSRIDLDFARALRAILRQDPDVVMVGEIRDLETARIAVQASLTGHLLLATLHTNDACAAASRLLDMGVEPFLLASSLSAVIAQRLVRRLCPGCLEWTEADVAAAKALPGLPAGTPIARARGCPACGGSGYRGRSGLFELLEVGPEVASAIHERVSEAELRQRARALGAWTPLREDGLRRILAGETSLEEVLRVIRD